MASSRQTIAIAKRHLALRDQLWPEQEAFLWDRKANKGFATIPKTLPLVLNIMDDMTKGAPVSATYLALWCATWDNSYVPITKPTEMSIVSGFGGQRGEHTWAGRMKKLKELHFIDIKPGKSGPMSHVVIFNPHIIIRYHHDVAKTPGLTEASFTGLIERAMEIGAEDMLKPLVGMTPSAEGPIPWLVEQARAEKEAQNQKMAALMAQAAQTAKSVGVAAPFPMPTAGAMAAPAMPAVPSSASGDATTTKTADVSPASPEEQQKV